MRDLTISCIICLLSICFLPSSHPSMGALELTVDNVREKSGRIWVGIYRSPQDFLDREKARLIETTIDRTGRISLEVEDLEFGREYALAIFHDVNDNGELDRNFFGLPAEPWAFSGEPKTRLRLPYFQEVKFRFGLNTSKQTLRLRKW